MTALAFMVGIALLFAVVLTWEGEPENRKFSLRPAGLLRWFVSGNWPAKVGAVLLVISTGALLRYLMLNIDLPASGKLLAGVAFSALFGVVSGMLKAEPKYRAMHLALGGASLGTAYLTAYSAYGFFHFVSDSEALALLFFVAIGATYFAILSRALSIALLAMVGAYIAPAFALESPGPVPVYGYYLTASLLTLVMVWQRGWRPLIHLSFLFTLAGALFFGWTQKFYTPEYYVLMQPLLLALVAVHLGMPLVERAKVVPGMADVSWQQRLDAGYFLLLPLVAAILTLLIAPDANREGALGLLALTALWGSAAAIEYKRDGEGALHYAGVALALLLTSVLLALGHVSFFLIGTVVACVLLVLGPRGGVGGQYEGLLVTVALASAACYLLQALFVAAAATPFFNAALARNMVMAAALGTAGWSMRKRGHSMASVFLALAVAWTVIIFLREFIHLYVGHLSQAFHLLLLVTTVVYALWVRRSAPKLSYILLLGLGLFYTALFCAGDFSFKAILLLMLAGQLVFSALAYMAGGHAEEGESVAGVARSMLPLLLFPWAVAYSYHVVAPHMPVTMTLLVASALFASLQAQWMIPRGRYWPNTLSPVGFIIFSAWLFYQVLFHIEREPWAVAYELVALVYMVQTSRFLVAAGNRDARLFGTASAIAVAGVSAAMILRLFGPPGTLTILAINDMLLPAVVSLSWVVIGSIMTWWAAQNQSRSLWSLGAVLLVAAAIKLVLFDFGSLGQLGNILAMMAAGAIFLLVAWLTPFPPKAEKESQPSTAPGQEQTVSSGRIWIWILVGLLVFGAFMMTMGVIRVLIKAPAPVPQQRPAVGRSVLLHPPLPAPFSAAPRIASRETA